MLLLAGLALLGFPLVLLPFMVLLSFSRPSGSGFLDSYKIKLFELFADGRVLDASKSWWVVVGLLSGVAASSCRSSGAAFAAQGVNHMTRRAFSCTAMLRE